MHHWQPQRSKVNPRAVDALQESPQVSDLTVQYDATQLVANSVDRRRESGFAQKIRTPDPEEAPPVSIRIEAKIGNKSPEGHPLYRRISGEPPQTTASQVPAKARKEFRGAAQPNGGDPAPDCTADGSCPYWYRVDNPDRELASVSKAAANANPEHLMQRMSAMQSAGPCRDLGPMNARTAQTMLVAARQSLPGVEEILAFLERQWRFGRWNSWGGVITALREDLGGWLLQTGWPHTEPVWPRKTETVAIDNPASDAELGEAVKVADEAESRRRRIAQAKEVLAKPKPMRTIPTGAVTVETAQELYQEHLRLYAEAREEAGKILDETDAP
jgi:hypothetical protein